jgi:hypothetical protein
MNESRSTKETAALDIGSRLELLVDDHLIDSLEGSRLKLHHPVPQEVSLQFDAPWEGPSSAFVTVMKDDDRYRMYYRGSGQGIKEPWFTIPHHYSCYAESEDGIAWTKPSLELFEHQGSRDNNIIWPGYPFSLPLMAFKDENPDAPPEERYKAVAGGPLIAHASPDGIHWKRMQEEPIIRQYEKCDSEPDYDAVAYWDAERGQYVAYIRGWRSSRSIRTQGEESVKLEEFDMVLDPIGESPKERLPGYRQLLRCTSPDFLHWTEPQFVDFGDTPLEHFYTSVTTPYFRAPHITLAFPKRYVPERKKIKEHLQSGVSDGVFMSSRDGVNFDRRFMEAFIRPGLDTGNWTERNLMTAWGVVPTGAEEISLYYGEHFRYPTCRLRRATLRTDGFVSVHADYAGGEFVTKPLMFAGAELTLNYSTSAVGSVTVEIQDAQGHPLPGYTLDDCEEIYGDEIEHAVQWRRGRDLTRLARQGIRLRFVLKDADLYSIRFLPLKYTDV